MNEEAENLEENLEAEEVAEVEEIEEGDSQEDVERAKKLGYKTDDEYTGNPKYKLSAKEYLERAEKGGVIKKLESDIAEIKTAAEKQQRFLKMQIETARRDREEALRVKQIKAIEDGADASEAFNAYEKGRKEIETQYSEPEAKNDDAPEIKRFYRENPWYNEDDDMQLEANALHRVIIAKHPTMPLDQQLSMVKRKIVERFPDKFENPKKKAQSIEGGGSVHNSNFRKKETLQSLGFDARDIQDVHRSIREGLYKDEADFIKSYTLLNKGRK